MSVEHLKQHSPLQSSAASAVRLHRRDVRDALSWLSPFVLTPALVLGTLATLDAALGGSGALALSCAFGVGVGAGAIAGAAFSATLRILYYAAVWVSTTVWATLAFGMTLSLFGTLGLGVRLQRGDPMAQITLAACIGLGLAAFVGGIALQPRRGRPEPWLFLLRPLFRALAGTAAVLGAAGVIAVDRTWASVGYKDASTALSWAAVGGITVAIVLAGGARLRTRLRLSASSAAAGAMVVMLPFFAVGLRPGVLPELFACSFPALSLRTLRGISDLDRDGYSALLGGGDCNDFSGSVNPSVREIPANGVDDNCLLGDAVAVRARRVQGGASVGVGHAARRSVVLITSDALSAVHMSAYGYERPTTPNIGKWAAERGVVYEKAYSVSASTLLSLGSIFRGVYPRRLHWTRIIRTSKERLLRSAEVGRMDSGEGVLHIQGLPVFEPRVPLSTRLRHHGLLTLAFTDDGPTTFLAPGTRLVGTFDEHVDDERLPESERTDVAQTRRVLDRLGALAPEQQFFLWVHYYGTHTPSTPHAGVPSFGTSLRDEYDHEIAAFDVAVAPLLRELTERQGRGEEIGIVLSADHGEELLGRRLHGHTLSESVVRVPLILSAPGVRPGRSKALVSTVDIFPTLLRVARAAVPGGLDGIDLQQQLRARSGESRMVFSDTWLHNTRGEVKTEQTMVSDGRVRLTFDTVDQTRELNSVERLREGVRMNELDRRDHRRLRAALEGFLEAEGPVRLWD